MAVTLLTRPDIRGDATRREFLIGSAALAALLAGCADDPRTATSSAAGGDPTAAPSSAPPSASPARVVALGQNQDADTLIALGIIPVGMPAGFSTDIYPWTQPALGGRSVELIRSAESLPLEQIAALRPDLIVATTEYGLDPVRTKLEAIAPVLGPGTSADREIWQQTTLRIGAAVGKESEARALVDKTEGVLRAAREAHPEWSGRTYTFGPVIPGQELYTVSSTADASAALLNQLGLELSPKVTALPESDTPGRATVSLENLAVLDADALLLLFFGDGGRDLESNPLFTQLDAVKRGSFIDVDPDVGIALAFPSVLSIPFGIERIVPQLEKALAARGAGGGADPEATPTP